MRNTLRHRVLAIPCALLLLAAGAAGLGGPGSQVMAEVEGSAELLYRNVSQDGSSNKYNEDFDGLSSGMRVGTVTLDWYDPDVSLADYARLSMTGLGGDPYESTSLTVGRADAYDLKFNLRKNDYLYDLFPVTDDEDGHAWNTERSQTDLSLRIHATDNIDVFLGFREVSRRGEHIFMKDIQRELFRLNAPLDQVGKRYTAGIDAKVGVVDIVFRQELLNKDNRFDYFSDGSPGLDPNGPTELTSYQWTQRDFVSSDYTTLKVHSPIGSRVDVTASAFGSFLGNEELKSRVTQDADGIDFNAAPFTITGGVSETDVEMDTFVGDLDVAVKIIDPLTLILQYRTLSREAEGEQFRDLENDPNTASTHDVMLDYQVDTVAGILEYQPHRTVRLRGGYRTTDRELERDGFGTGRDRDFESDGDETLIFGASWRPKDWLRFMASYEDGERDMAFTAPSLVETQRIQFRATINPQPDMIVGLVYSDFQNDNPFSNSTADGTSWSASFSHNATDRLSYMLSYAQQQIDSVTPVIFDTAGFGATDTGDTTFDADHTQGSFQINYKFTDAWRSFLRYTMAESDGFNDLVGDTTGVVTDFNISQEYMDAEAGLFYDFPTGLFVGGSFRVFDYDDDNDLVDYDGEILTLRAGMTF